MDAHDINRKAVNNRFYKIKPHVGYYEHSETKSGIPVLR